MNLEDIIVSERCPIMMNQIVWFLRILQKSQLSRGREQDYSGLSGNGSRD